MASTCSSNVRSTLLSPAARDREALARRHEAARLEQRLGRPDRRHARPLRSCPPAPRRCASIASSRAASDCRALLCEPVELVDEREPLVDELALAERAVERVEPGPQRRPSDRGGAPVARGCERRAGRPVAGRLDPGLRRQREAHARSVLVARQRRHPDVEQRVGLDVDPGDAGRGPRPLRRAPATAGVAGVEREVDDRPVAGCRRSAAATAGTPRRRGAGRSRPPISRVAGEIDRVSRAEAADVGASALPDARNAGVARRGAGPSRTAPRRRAPSGSACARRRAGRRCTATVKISTFPDDDVVGARRDRPAAGPGAPLSATALARLRQAPRRDLRHQLAEVGHHERVLGLRASRPSAGTRGRCRRPGSAAPRPGPPT